ncbi:hypothetical protein P3T73_02820 [Kiritimatiellota bacterium B12222]|nr:hypothetical protein P3T73_02820 [Kiritimatiellota bacterium B12222]
MNSDRPSHLFSPDRHGLLQWILILVCCGAGYGFSLGLWRSPLMGVFTAIKFPLLLLLVLVGNAGLNSMTAALMGVPLGFRQALQILLCCFAVFTMVLAACVPVFVFFTFSLGSADPEKVSSFYEGMVLMHVGLIALAGCASHLRLFSTVVVLSGDVLKARKLMICWLSANLLFGAQLSWNLRPFFGAPHAPVAFLREDPFERNFFEVVYTMAKSKTETLLPKELP